MTAQMHALIRERLDAKTCAFSIGGFGALAEFHDHDIEIIDDHDTGVTAACPRGAMSVSLRGGELLVAYETSAKSGGGWQIGLCVVGPRNKNHLQCRNVLSELGPDAEAINDADRKHVLFDLGVGLPHIDYCIRTSDTQLIRALRRHTGESLFADPHPLLDTLIEGSPHRVVRSSVARIEVYQPIDRHVTPTGPHTHLLPGLLKTRRTHAATTPLPEDTFPLLTLHPEHPFQDAAEGSPRFNPDVHSAFERLLDQYGDRAYVAAKCEIQAAVKSGKAPASVARADTRLARTAQRIALRQLHQLGIEEGVLAAWQQHFGY